MPILPAFFVPPGPGHQVSIITGRTGAAWNEMFAQHSLSSPMAQCVAWRAPMQQCVWWLVRALSSS